MNTETTLHPTVISFWKDRGYDVGPDSGGIVNGLPAKVKKVTPRPGNKKLPGRIDLDTLRDMDESEFQALRRDRKTESKVIARELLRKRVKLLNEDLLRTERTVIDQYACAKEELIFTKSTAAELVHAVAELHGFTADDLTGPRRFKKLAYARMHAYAVIRTVLGWSYPRIGKMFGDRDHTTVMHGVKRFDELRANDVVSGDIGLDRVLSMAKKIGAAS